MQRHKLLIALLALSSTLAIAAPPVPLREGESLTVTGKLRMRPAGHLHFVTVETADGFEIPGGKPIHALALAGYGNYRLLYSRRGQSVTVRGKVLLDDASPYYRDGAIFDVTSIRAKDGTELKGEERLLHPIAVDVGSYRSTVLLPKDLSAPWRYSLEGKPTDKRMMSCSSNGAGDVVNCFCAQGFRPVKATSSVKDPDHAAELLGGMAQFGVGEDALEMTLSVTCSR